MKKQLFVIVLLVLSVSAFAETHTVARGETLQSIAAKYHITTDQLINANPGTDKLFYVGLKLNIPEVSNTTSTKTETSDQAITPNNSQTLTATAETHYETNLSHQTVADENDKPGAEFAFMLEYGFIPKEKIPGGNSNGFAMVFTYGANYYFMHHRKGLFAGARIGYGMNYKLVTLRDERKITVFDSKTQIHYISLPINLGYSFTTNNTLFGISPFVGIDFNYSVAGKNTINNEGITNKTDVKKEFAVNARLGVQLRLSDFNIGCSYLINLNKEKELPYGIELPDEMKPKRDYFSISIAYGF